MTACTGIQQQLSAYIDGALTGEERRRIEEHLSSCGKCSATLADLRKTGDLLRNLDEVEPPPWLTEKIIGQVREEAEKKGTLFQRLFYPLPIKVPVEAFATLLVVVLGLYVYKATTGPEIKTATPPQAGIEKGVPAVEPSKRPERAPTETPVFKYESPLPETVPREKGFITVPPPAEHRTTSENQKDRDAESSLVKEAPSAAPATHEKESAVSAGTAMSDQKEEMRLRTQVTLRSPESEKSAPITLAIKVEDIEAATQEVEHLLNRLGATAVNKDMGSTETVITALLPAKNLQLFHEGLKVIGPIRPTAGPSYNMDEGVLSLRLEISGK